MSPIMETPPQTRDSSPRKNADKRMSGPNLTRTIIEGWQRTTSLLAGAQCTIDGESLDIPAIVAVGKYGVSAALSHDSSTLKKINDSVEMLRTHLEGGHLVYGVTTGFGGSADTRTTDLESLQLALVQHQNSGILTSRDIGRNQSTHAISSVWQSRNMDADFSTNSMPTSWVRASMLTRCNSMIRGHSAVRIVVAETILELLKRNITPVVPLRGSISASGDLSPLSYIAGAIQGCPDIFVRCGNEILTADVALKREGISPITLGPKEGLGLLNGTAFSAATASLALHQAQELALLSQVLTAMAVEALRGSAESFWPQIAHMRPHPGQIESASNILAFLEASELAQCVKGAKDTKMTGLYQDRYALRTASQWIGPQLEDLCLAQSQLTIELNSTTDNPLMDVESDHILHGGNFQAAVVTSTMDRTRLCLERLGKMMFSQATELINPLFNKGLPANLAADDPSLSYTCKGIDINMASYMSELGFLANPVGNHVQSAEMHNQALNSLALISARYTFQALDVLYLMAAAYLFTVCQALDLRVLEVMFMNKVKDELQDLVQTTYGTSDDALVRGVWRRFLVKWPATSTLDLHQRCEETGDAMLVDIVKIGASGSGTLDLVAAEKFTTDVRTLLQGIYEQARVEMFRNHETLTPGYLGNGTRRMYHFVRRGLGIRMHQGLAEHPTPPAANDTKEQQERRTIGSRISVIFEGLRDGRAMDVLVACAGQAYR
ncbi:hypothetical protein AAFC00_003222 [Neodothiora populina]|uniref:Phenylalanine ammonia-lyase n=1 Tax=Neodothiora populina TaxID=2781224 RepID=A0ABR3P9Y5_9PEZI